MPPVAWHTPGNNLSPAFNLSFNGNATRSRIYRLGYYAAVAYTDYNIGRLLNALDGLGDAVAKRTVTCVFGDHGWVRQRVLCFSALFHADQRRYIVSISGRPTRGRR